MASKVSLEDLRQKAMVQWFASTAGFSSRRIGIDKHALTDVLADHLPIRHGNMDWIWIPW